MKRLAILCALSFFSAAAAAACTSWGKPGKLLHADDFGAGLDRWVAEFKAAPGSVVEARGHAMAIDVAGGATVWFRPELTGNVVISYGRTIVMDGGANDRLSDMNQFWMARDPRNASLYTRDGTFEQYDGLRMYYAGIGGNTNTTTRLRKYHGNGERELLADLAGPDNLLQPNRRYAIEIAVQDGCTRVRVDGRPVFTYLDPAPLREGHFGFRTTHSRQLIDHFEVRTLDTDR